MSQDANISMSARAHSASASEKRAGEEQPTLMATILDPFCGTGVVLQEALLMGYEAYGTDLEPRMINYSEANLTWLTTTYHVPPTTYHVEVGDATSHHWKTENGKRKIAVVCETYLGRPFTTAPSRQVLEQTVSDVNLILKKFLANIRGQLAPGTRLCLAVPAWQLAPGKFRHLPLIDSLTDLGYECHRFTHISEKDLVYYREGQIVGRELLVLQSKP